LLFSLTFVEPSLRRDLQVVTLLFVSPTRPGDTFIGRSLALLFRLCRMLLVPPSQPLTRTNFRLVVPYVAFFRRSLFFQWYPMSIFPPRFPPLAPGKTQSMLVFFFPFLLSPARACTPTELATLSALHFPFTRLVSYSSYSTPFFSPFFV